LEEVLLDFMTRMGVGEDKGVSQCVPAR